MAEGDDKAQSNQISYLDIRRAKEILLEVFQSHLDEEYANRKIHDSNILSTRMLNIENRIRFL